MSKTLVLDIQYKGVIMLPKTLYGLVQAVSQWCLIFDNMMLDMIGIKKSNEDPCLMYRNNNPKILLLILYVGDTMVIRDNYTLVDVKQT